MATILKTKPDNGRTGKLMGSLMDSFGDAFSRVFSSPQRITTKGKDLLTDMSEEVASRFRSLPQVPERVAGELAWDKMAQRVKNTLPVRLGASAITRASERFEANTQNKLLAARSRAIDEFNQSQGRELDQFGLPKATLTQANPLSGTLSETATPEEKALAQGMASAEFATNFVGGGSSNMGRETLTKLGKTKLLDGLAKEMREEGVERVLKEIGYDNTLIPKVKGLIAQAKSPKRVEAILEGFDNALPLTKARGIGEKIIPPQQRTGGLIDEAYEIASRRTEPDIPIDTIDEAFSAVNKTRTYTPTSKKVNFVDYFLRSPRDVFQKIGLEKTYDKAKKAYENYGTELESELARVRNWASQARGEESNKRIFRFLDGKGGELSETEAKVAKEIRETLNTYADRLGLPQESRVSEYITHLFPKDGGEIPDEVLRVINKLPDSIRDPFLSQRTGDLGYLEDTWEALNAYIRVGQRKIHLEDVVSDFADLEGKLDNSAFDYIQSIGQKVLNRPTKMEIGLNDFIKEKIGGALGNRPAERSLSFLRKMTSAAKLGFSITSGLKNLTQGVNTFAELGAEFTVKGYANLLRGGKPAVKELVDNGVLQDALAYEGTDMKALSRFWNNVDKATFFNFQLTELINRGAAYFGAKAKALNSGLAEEEAIEYAKRMAEKTQFKFGALDTPVGLNNQIGKTLLQFQTYNLKQLEFIAKMLKERNYGSIFRYMVASGLVFEVIGKHVGMSYKDMLPMIRMFGDYVPPILQFPNEVRKSISGEDKYGNEMSGEKRVKNVIKSGIKNLVPGGTQLYRSLEGLSLVGSGGKKTTQGRSLYRVKPTTSNYIKAGTLGASSLKESRDYYENKGGKKKITLDPKDYR